MICRSLTQPKCPERWSYRCFVVFPLAHLEAPAALSPSVAARLAWLLFTPVEAKLLCFDVYHRPPARQLRLQLIVANVVAIVAIALWSAQTDAGIDHRGRRDSWKQQSTVRPASRTREHGVVEERRSAHTESESASQPSRALCLWNVVPQSSQLSWSEQNVKSTSGILGIGRYIEAVFLNCRSR